MLVSVSASPKQDCELLKRRNQIITSIPGIQQGPGQVSVLEERREGSTTPTVPEPGSMLIVQ